MLNIVTREVKLKPQCDTMTYLLEQQKFKRLTIPSAGEDVNYPEHSYIAGGNVNETITFENSLSVC